MPCHKEVLNAAKFIVRSKGINQFTPKEVVQHLKNRGTTYTQSTINTHIVSRCCVNAPEHHAVRYEYFERIGRGLYMVIE
jgi:arginine repressor